MRVLHNTHVLKISIYRDLQWVVFDPTVLMISTATSGGKATATGSAPGEIDFEASAFQCTTSMQMTVMFRLN